MGRGEMINKIFLTIDRILEEGEIIFSRQSLWSKLNRISKTQDDGRREFNQVLRRSVEHNWIEIQEKGEKVFYRLTPLGVKKLSLYKFNEIKINRGKWDGFWRLIVFDIPETERQGRDALRKVLQHFGFYSLQKSVFIYPYECKNEIDYIVEIFNLGRYVNFMIVKEIDINSELKNKFKIK